ncbi:MAG: DHA2 family efflux MFS transporter permease subunit [Chloroflexi bacterium]|nr:DHA2 family efflux MFS transporter permease subunit [Chloroflexota bacterium]
MTKSIRSPRFTETMVLIVTILGTGMVYLDQTAITVALPRMQIALKADVGGLQWLIDIYILTLGVLLLIGGALGDRYGRVRVFIIGTVIFVGSSIICGAANSLGLLIAARAVQGVGGALLVPGGLAIVNATVAPERRGRTLGLWATFSPLITLSAPLLGGWFVDNVSWRAVFFLNVPLGAVALIVAARYVPESRDEHAPEQLDWPGVAALMVGLGGVLFGLIEGPHLGWNHPLVAVTLIAGALGLAAFVVVEWRSPAPLLPLGLFRNRTFTGINAMTTIHYLALSSIFFFLTLNFQQAQKYPAFIAGLAQMPISLTAVLLARPVGRLTDRIGPAPLMTAGVLLTCGAFLLFTWPGVGAMYWTTFLPATLLYGVGLGLTVVPLTAVALGSLPARYSGIASGFNHAVTRVGQMIAVAVFGAVMASAFRAGLIARTADLPLGASARTQLLAEARNLGATRPPSSLAPDLARATEAAIRLAFVDGFRQIMILSAVLALVGLVIMLVLVRYQPHSADDSRVAAKPETTTASAD